MRVMPPDQPRSCADHEIIQGAAQPLCRTRRFFAATTVWVRKANWTDYRDLNPDFDDGAGFPARFLAVSETRSCGGGGLDPNAAQRPRI